MTVRPYTTGVYVLRCLEVGLRPSDLDLMEYGEVLDIITEKANDRETYDYKATQEDFDRF